MVDQGMSKQRLPRSKIEAYGLEEETKTSCPACSGSGNERCRACRGCGKASLEPMGGSMYRFVLCEPCGGNGILGLCRFCRGAKMVTASSASAIRRSLS